MTEGSSLQEHPGLAAREARKRGDVEFLVSLLSSTDWVARLAAAQELGELGSKAGVPALVRCLQAADEGLRISALKALATIGDQSVAQDIFEVASGDEAFGVRATAAETLGRLGDRRAPTILASLLTAPDNPYPRSYRKWATKLLVELGGHEAVPALRAAQSGAGLLGRWKLGHAIRSLEKGA